MSKMNIGGVYLRGILYIGIAMLTELHPILVEKGAGGEVDWIAVGVKLALVGAITLRAYIDKSLGDHEHQVAIEEKKVGAELESGASGVVALEGVISSQKNGRQTEIGEVKLGGDRISEVAG